MYIDLQCGSEGWFVRTGFEPYRVFGKHRWTSQQWHPPNQIGSHHQIGSEEWERHRACST